MVLLAYAALGAITGLISALFIHSVYGFEHFFENRVKLRPGKLLDMIV
jgi:H+/Cl- antiporter ClcA